MALLFFPQTHGKDRKTIKKETKMILQVLRGKILLSYGLEKATECRRVGWAEAMNLLVSRSRIRWWWLDDCESTLLEKKT